MRSLRGVIAEYERLKILERTARGCQSKMAQGLVVGTSDVPFGYTYETNGHGIRVKLAIDPETGPIARQMLLDLRTRSSIDVADDLNQRGIPAPKKRGWKPATIQKMARNETYVGRLRWGNSEVAVPALLTY